LLAAGGYGHILLLDLTSHAALRTRSERYRLQTSALALSPDGQTLLVGSPEGTLRFFDPLREQPIGAAVPAHRGAVNGVAFSPDGRTVASCGSDQTVVLFDHRSHGQIGILPFAATAASGRPGSLIALAYSPRGDLLAAGQNDGRVFLWELPGRNPLGDPL